MDVDGGRGRQVGTLSRTGAAAIFVLATAVIAVTAHRVYRHYADDIVARAEADLLAISQEKKTGLEHELRERIADAAIFAQRAPVWSALEPHPLRDMHAATAQSMPAVVAQTRKAYAYRRVVVLDQAGRPVYPPDAGALEAPVRAAAALAVASRRPALVDVHRNARDEVNFGIVHPVFAGGDERAGVIGAAYLEIDAMARLFPLVAAWPTTPSRTGESLLVRQEGDQVLHLNAAHGDPAGAPLSLRRPAQDPRLLASRSISAPAGVIRGAVDYRGVPVLGAAVRIDGTPWVLVSKIDLAEAEEELHALARAAGILAGLFTLMAGAFSILLWRSESLRGASREAALARKYVVAVGTTRDGFARLDAAGRIVEANAVLAAMTGYSREELARLAIEDLEAGIAREQVPEFRRRFQASGGARFQTRWRRKDGSLFDVDISASFVKDRDGAFSFAYVRDVSETIEQGRRLKRLNEYYAFLTRIDRTIGRLRDPREILDAVCRAAVAEAGFTLAWAGVVNAAQDGIELACAYGAAADYARALRISLDPALPAGQGPAAISLRENRIVAANDFLNDPRTAPWQAQARVHGIRASAAVPVSVDGRAQAVLNIYSAVPGYFDDEMVRLLAETARNLGLAWEAGEAARERNIERSKRVEGEVALRDSEHRFRGMVEQTLAGFYVVQGNDIVYANPRMAEMGGYTVEELLGRDPLEFVEPEDRPKVVEERKRLSAGHKTIAYRVRVRRKDGTQVVAGIVGTLGNWDGRPALIVMVEDITDRTRIEEQAADYLRRLEASMRNTLQATARMVELRDPYTAGHERRVGLIAGAIAREMGWAESRCHSLELVGLVHDVGKIAVPAEILAKPSRLSAPEYELVKVHAQASYDILKDVEFDGLPVAEICRQHHERLDGSGYPQGLKGAQILPEARVLAVADVVESMSSHRPYRPALGLEAALAELAQGSGRLYEAAAVEALLRLLREKGYALPD